MSQIPPVKVRFVAEGVEDVLAAFKSIAEATAAQQKRAVEVTSATKESVKAAKEAARAHKDVAKAVGRSDGGRRQIASGQAVRAQSGGGAGGIKIETGIKLGNLAREIVLANVAMDAFRKMVGVAGSALSQFGGYMRGGVVNYLKRGTSAMQIANRAGGQIASGEMRTFMTDLSQRFSAIPDDQIAGVLKATTNRLELPQAKETGVLALKMSQAFGYDPTQMADALAQRRAAMPGLDAATFEGLTRAEFGKLQAKGSGMRSFEELASMKGSLSGMTDRFVSPSADDKTRAATEIGLVGIVSQAASKMKGAEQAGEGVNALLADLGKLKGTSAGFGRLRGLDAVLPELMKSVGGDANKLAGKGFSEGSVKLIRALGLESIYRESEAGKKGSGEEAVRKRMSGVMGVDVGAAATFATEEKRAEADAGIQLERAIRRVRDAFALALAPTIEGKLIPALVAATPKLVAFVAALAGLISNTDLVGLFKDLAKGLALGLYYMLDALGSLPGVNINRKALAALGAAAGIGPGEMKATDVDQNLAADRMLHPQLYRGLLENNQDTIQGTVSRSTISQDLGGGVLSAALAPKKEAEQASAALSALGEAAKSLALDLASVKKPERTVPLAHRVNQ